MQVESCVQDGKTVAVITGTELVPTGAQSALDLIMTRAMRRTPASSQSKELRLRVWCVRMRYLCIEKASARRQRLFRFVCCLFVQIAGQQLLQQLIAVKAADETAGVVVVGDIRRIL